MTDEYRRMLLEDIIKELEPDEHRKYLLEFAFESMEKTPLENFKTLCEFVDRAYERGYNEGQKQLGLDRL